MIQTASHQNSILGNERPTFVGDKVIVFPGGRIQVQGEKGRFDIVTLHSAAAECTEIRQGLLRDEAVVKSSGSRQTHTVAAPIRDIRMAYQYQGLPSPPVKKTAPYRIARKLGLAS